MQNKLGTSSVIICWMSSEGSHAVLQSSHVPIKTIYSIALLIIYIERQFLHLKNMVK